MKKLLKGLLVTAFAVSTITASTNKTFLMPRSQGVNLAMEYATYNELIQDNNGDFFGANFQVVPFYMESSDKNDIGKYFGMSNKNVIKLGNGAAVTAGTADLNYRYIVHDEAPAADAGDGLATLTFEPKLQAYGVRIDYYQDLEKILDGLYLKIALPIVHVENKMNMSIEDLNAPLNTNTPSNIYKYFDGTYGNGTPANTATGQINAQEALEYAKRTGSHSETSVADIDVILGYKLLEKDNYYVALNLGLTIPVGNTPDGTWVFEPVVGNGNHWGFGGGLDASVKLWEDGNQNIKLTAVANYRYLFEGTEKRTLGLKGTDGSQLAWGQYNLAGKVGTACSAQQLIPVANLLTQNVSIEPGSQFDSIIYFTYNNGGWTIDLGYNFFWKDGENAHMKNTWTNQQYIIVQEIQAMNVAGQLQNYTQAATAGQNGGSLGYINVSPNNAAMLAAADSGTAFGIDTSVAETPSQDTHKIFGALGYIFKDWEYPVMLGLGGGYEFAPDDGIEDWQIFGKLGIKF